MVLPFSLYPPIGIHFLFINVLLMPSKEPQWVMRIKRLIAGIKTKCFRVLPDNKLSIETVWIRGLSCFALAPNVWQRLSNKTCKLFYPSAENKSLPNCLLTAFSFIGDSLLLVKIKRLFVAKYFFAYAEIWDLPSFSPFSHFLSNIEMQIYFQLNWKFADFCIWWHFICIPCLEIFMWCRKIRTRLCGGRVGGCFFQLLWNLFLTTINQIILPWNAQCEKVKFWLGPQNWVKFLAPQVL